MYYRRHLSSFDALQNRPMNSGFARVLVREAVSSLWKNAERPITHPVPPPRPETQFAGLLLEHMFDIIDEVEIGNKDEPDEPLIAIPDLFIGAGLDPVVQDAADGVMRTCAPIVVRQTGANAARWALEHAYLRLRPVES